MMKTNHIYQHLISICLLNTAELFTVINKQSVIMNKQ